MSILFKNDSKIDPKRTENEALGTSKWAQDGPKLAIKRKSNMEPKFGGLWERLRVSLERLRSVLGRLWGRLGGVLGRLGASCGCLGDVLEVSCGRFSVQRGLNLGMLSWIPFFNRFLVDFASQNRSPNLEKSLNSIGKNHLFLLSGYFNITSLLV